MKKSILILMLSIGIAKAQTDSSMIKLQKQVEHIQFNLKRSHDVYTQGVVIHAAGAMTDVIAIIGYKFYFLNKNQMKSTLIIGGAFHIVGSCFIFYSHRYIDRASLDISLTGFKYTF